MNQILAFILGMVLAYLGYTLIYTFVRYLGIKILNYRVNSLTNYFAKFFIYSSLHSFYENLKKAYMDKGIMEAINTKEFLTSWNSSTKEDGDFENLCRMANVKYISKSKMSKKDLDTVKLVFLKYLENALSEGMMRTNKSVCTRENKKIFKANKKILFNSWKERKRELKGDLNNISIKISI